MTLQQRINITRKKDLAERHEKPDEEFGNKCEYRTGLQRFLDKWGEFYHKHISVKGFPDEDDERYRR